MSRRNTLEGKRARRTRRSITKGTKPTKINLVEYLKMRANITTGMAHKVLLSGSVKVDSHPIGFTREKDGSKVLKPEVDSKLRPRIRIEMSKELRDA